MNPKLADRGGACSLRCGAGCERVAWRVREMSGPNARRCASSTAARASTEQSLSERVRRCRARFPILPEDEGEAEGAGEGEVGGEVEGVTSLPWRFVVVKEEVRLVGRVRGRKAAKPSLTTLTPAPAPPPPPPPPPPRPTPPSIIAPRLWPPWGTVAERRTGCGGCEERFPSTGG